VVLTKLGEWQLCLKTLFSHKEAQKAQKSSADF
jgi:hypothetical protein